MPDTPADDVADDAADGAIADGTTAGGSASSRSGVAPLVRLERFNRAVLELELALPTGEVLSVKRRKSSGHAGYDAAVERAIYAASPLPKPDQPGTFRRDLELKFRPKDQ